MVDIENRKERWVDTTEIKIRRNCGDNEEEAVRTWKSGKKKKTKM